MKMTYTSSIVRKNLLVSQWQNSWSLSGSWDQIKSGDPSKRVRHCPGFCCTDFPSWNTSNYCPGNVPGSVATNIWRDFLYVCFTVSTIRWASSVLAELFPFSSQYNIYSPALSCHSIQTHRTPLTRLRSVENQILDGHLGPIKRPCGLTAPLCETVALLKDPLVF